MTGYRLAAVLAALAALAAVAAAVWLALHGHPLAAALTAWTAPSFAVIAARCRTAHYRTHREGPPGR